MIKSPKETINCLEKNETINSLEQNRNISDKGNLENAKIKIKGAEKNNISHQFSMLILNQITKNELNEKDSNKSDNKLL